MDSCTMRCLSWRCKICDISATRLSIPQSHVRLVRVRSGDLRGDPDLFYTVAACLLMTHDPPRRVRSADCNQTQARRVSELGGSAKRGSRVGTK